MNTNNTILFSGSSNLQLAERIVKALGIELGKIDLARFADGEQRPWVMESVRDKTVFVIESLSFPMDEHVMELTLIGDAVRRSAPKTMIAVIPYLGYARQDKQHRIGEPVSARVIAKFIEVSKFREVITVDLHNDAVVGFFSIPVTHLTALDLLASEIRKLDLTDAVVISPDVGGVKRARNLAYSMDLPMVVMEKKRYLDRRDTSEAFQIIGDVRGKTAIIIDDIISTGGTTANSAQSLKAGGARSVIVAATHGILAGDALEKLRQAPIDRIYLTDTIQNGKEKLPKNATVVSVSQLLADAISRVIGS